MRHGCVLVLEIMNECFERKAHLPAFFFSMSPLFLFSGLRWMKKIWKTKLLCMCSSSPLCFPFSSLEWNQPPNSTLLSPFGSLPSSNIAAATAADHSNNSSRSQQQLQRQQQQQNCRTAAESAAELFQRSCSIRTAATAAEFQQFLQ